MAIFPNFSATPSKLEIEELNCVRILEYAPTVFTANCAIPAFEEGHDIALPADKHSISIRQPLPKPFFSPITKESGINTSLPLVGPFGH